MTCSVQEIRRATSRYPAVVCRLSSVATRSSTCKRYHATRTRRHVTTTRSGRLPCPLTCRVPCASHSVAYEEHWTCPHFRCQVAVMPCMLQLVHPMLHRSSRDVED